MVGGRRVIRGWVAALVVVAAAGATAASGGAGAIKSPDLREWLTYISSDELEGRAVFTTGFGLAAGYIADHLHAWGVKPAGDHGSYLQTVRVLGVKTTSRSTVSVTVNGETRTFADGEGITFPRNMGGKHRFTVDRVEFAGYGLDAPGREPCRFSRQGRAGRGGRLARDERPEEHRSQRLPARAQRTQPLRDRAAWRSGEHRPAS